jgi:mRNA interferase MazF
VPIDLRFPIDAGDIFWITLPVQMAAQQQAGGEQHGRRPCIVMSRRAVNNLGKIVVVVPMTTNLANAGGFRVLLPAAEIIRDVGCNSVIETSVALCHQVRAVDKTKFESKMGKLSQNAVLAVQLGLTYLFDIR